MYINVVKHQKSHKYLYIIYIIYSKCVYICNIQYIYYIYIYVYICMYLYIIDNQFQGPFQVSFLKKVSKHIKHIILIKAV